MEPSLNWNRIELEPIANWYWIGAELISHRYSSVWGNVLGFKGLFFVADEKDKSERYSKIGSSHRASQVSILSPEIIFTRTYLNISF